MAKVPITSKSNAQRGATPTIYRTLNLGDHPRSCTDLLSELRTPSQIASSSLEFGLMDGRDVYRFTAPFYFDGKTLIAGRVEKRDTESSEIIIFERVSPTQWKPHFTSPEFQGLQDPCITWANEELVLGGVRFPIPMGSGHGYVMDFYRGSSLDRLHHFLSGPPGMKDIRFKQLTDGHVAIFNRPQGAVGGRGEIGFTIASSWEAITSEMIATAPLFKGQFLREEWGGVNEAHLLANGRLGLLGHIACFDGRGDRHYYPMAFSVDPDTRQNSPIHVIAQRNFFPPGPSKRQDIVDVVFSGGLVRNDDGTADLYAGTSDAAAAVVKLSDPFLQFEN